MEGLGRRAVRRALVALEVAILATLSVPAWANPAQELDADTALEACDEAARQEPDRLSSFTCYGRLAVSRNLWEPAMSRLEAHVERLPDNPYPLGALAYLTGLRGEARTEALLRRVLAIYAAREAPPLSELVWTRVALAQFLSNRGRPAEGLDQLEAAASAARAAGDDAEQANVAIRRSELLRAIGEFDLALGTLREVEPAARGSGRAYLLRDWLSAMGAAQFEVGLAAEAIASWRLERDLLRRLGDRRGEAGALYNIALASEELVRQGALDAETCVRRYEQTLVAARAAGDRHPESRAVCFLAREEQDDSRRARLLRECVEAAESTGHVALIADAWVQQAREWVLRGGEADREQGLGLLDRALSLVLDAAEPLAEARVRFARHGVFWWLLREQGGDPRWKRAALEEGRRLLAADELLSRQQTEAATRMRLMDRRAAEFEQLAGNLLLAGGGRPERADLELAFETLERKRAQELRRQLDAGGGPGARADADADAGSIEWRTAWTTLRWLRGRLRQGGLAHDDESRLRRQAAALEQRIGELREGRATVPTALDRLQPPRPATLGAIESALGDDEAVLSFQIDSRAAGHADFFAGSWVLVHLAHGTRVVRLEDCAEVAREAEWLNGLIDRRDGGEREAAARLYTKLVEPALESLPERVTRLVIVPDAELASVPFAVLGPSGGQPLGVRFALSRTPSLTAWLHWREAADAPTEKVLIALADPGGSAEALPAGRYEAAEAIRTLGGDSRLLSGAEATVAGLRRTLGGFRMLHLAAHAEVDPLHPERSAVRLAAGRDGETGRLGPAEIAGLDLSGKAVALASCRGASGLRLEGEGVVSLARSFLAAGAHAVVAALDPLRDGEAGALFPPFYDGLARGECLDQALQGARRQRWREGAPAAAWARVLLIGDGGHVVLPGGRGLLPSGLRLLSLVAGLIALGALARGIARLP